MIRHSPAERYLIYMVTDPAPMTDEQVIEHANELAIPWLSRRYLARLRASNPTPKKFQPRNKKSTASMKFLDDRGIRCVYFPTPTSRAVMAILDNSRVRESAEALLLAACPLPIISKTLQTCHGVKYGPEVVELYRDLFFDTACLSQVELRALLDLQSDPCNSEQDPDLKAQQRALRRARRHDPRKVAASMPSGPLAAIAVAWKMGKWPSALDPHAALERIRDTAVLRAIISVTGGTEGIQVASQLMQVARVAQELLSGTTRPEASVLDKYKAFVLDHDDRNLPHVTALGGEYTTDLGKIRRGEAGVEEEAGSSVRG